jgi:hypothetical protein
MQELQHTKKIDKYLKHVSETLAKTHGKTLENHCKHMQRSDETLAKHLKTT